MNNVQETLIVLLLFGVILSVPAQEIKEEFLM